MGFHFAHKPPDSRPLPEQLAAGGAVLVEFVERGAPACRLEEPILAQIDGRYGDRLRVVRVDVDSAPDDAASFAVSAVPTFVLFVDGREKCRLVGYQSVDDLARALDRAFAAPG
jgi:thioredoxin 1